MNQSDLIPPHRLYESNFVTTIRNLFFHWLANLTIVPVYAAAFAQIIIGILYGKDGVFAALSLETRVIASCIVALGAGLQIFVSVLAPPYWHTGFSNRQFSILSSLILAYTWFSQPLVEAQLVFTVVVLVAFIWLIIGLFRLLLSFPRMIMWTSFSLLILVIGGWVSAQSSLVLTIPVWIALPLWMCASVGNALYAILRIWSWIKRTWGKSELINASITTCSLFLALMGIYILFDVSNQGVFVRGLYGLTVLLLSSNPRHFASKHFAYLRFLVRSFRQDHFQTRLSYIIETRNPLRQLINGPIPKFLSPRNRVLYSIILLFFGMITLPFLFNLASPDEALFVGPSSNLLVRWSKPYQAIDLIGIGVISSIIILTAYWTLWIVMNRSRYIVTEFISLSDTSQADTNPEIRAVAKITTHLLVEEMQKIATLLKLRQVERLDFNRDDTRAFFVTSGSNEEFLDQIHQVVTLEVSGSKFNLATLISILLRSLARIRLQGQVRKRTNGTVEIWAELHYSNNRTVAVDVVLSPESPIEHIDDVILRPIVRELALKLVVELGLAPYLGSTWKTLGYFLEGLEATSKRDWWHAISMYRTAIQYEKTLHRKFGIGHYHLGAALYFQGNAAEGFEEIKKAEEYGPPMADCHYLHALILLYSYWSVLHTHPKILSEIIDRCNLALNIRPDFAEAYQLRGTAYYRSARQLDRARSEIRYTLLKQPIRDEVSKWHVLFSQYRRSQTNYRRALRDFSASIRSYDRAEGRLRRQQLWRNEAQLESRTLIERRMTAAHQMADTLRSVGRYAEADTYYDDVGIAFPRNSRNISSRAKNYCLANNWQRAEDFIKRSAMKFDSVAWDADIHLHLAWATFGGIDEERRKSVKRSLGLAIRTIKTRHKDQAHLIGEVLKNLDYALHQRPRFAVSWRQSDWFTSFMNSSSNIASSNSISDAPAEFINRVFVAKLVLPLEDTSLARLWILLRLKLLGFRPADDITELAAFENSETHTQAAMFKPFFDLLDILVNLRSKTVELDEANLDRLGDDKVLVGGLRNQFRRLELAQQLHLHWVHTHNIFEDLFIKTISVSQNGERVREKTELTFAERWAADLYLELSCLTCRILAEAEAYELLREVSNSSMDCAAKWIRFWHDTHKKKENPKLVRDTIADDALTMHTFSPIVNVFQRQTLQLWTAFAAFKLQFDPLSIARSAVNSGEQKPTKLSSHERVLDEVQQSLDVAKRVLPYHPLLMFLQALVYRQAGLTSQAIEEFERLLDIVSLYEPNRDVAENSLAEPVTRNDPFDQRGTLFWWEKAVGRQQFHNIVNRVSLRSHLAEIYTDLGRPELSIKHLIEAIRWSPHADLNVDNMLKLANQLHAVDRYDEALAVIEATRVPTQQLYFQRLAETKREVPSILEATINSRRLRFEHSMLTAKRIAHEFDLITPQTLSENAKERLDELAKISSHRMSPLVSGGNNDFRQIDLQQREFDYLIWAIRAIVNRRLPSPTNMLDSSAETFTAPFSDIFANWMKRLLAMLKDSGDDIVKATSKGIALKASKRQQTLPSTFSSILERILGQFEPNYPIVPRVFVKLSKLPLAEKRLDQIALLATCSLNREALPHVIKQVLSYTRKDMDPAAKLLVSEFSEVMISHVVMFLAKQARNTLVQIAELCNTLSYSRIEQDAFGEQYPDIDSRASVTIMSFLVAASDRDTKYHRQYANMMAQFLDTFAWTRYRRGMREIRVKDLSQLVEPNLYIVFKQTEDLLQQAIRYDPTRAIIHHHLSILYLARVEFKWLDRLQPQHQVLSSDADVIDINLKQSLRAWHEASRHDVSGRLHKRLARQYHRILDFEKAWDEQKFGLHKTPGRPD